MKRLEFTTVENEKVSFEELTSMKHPHEANEDTLREMGIMAMNIDSRIATFEIVDEEAK